MPPATSSILFPYTTLFRSMHAKFDYSGTATFSAVATNLIVPATIAVGPLVDRKSTRLNSSHANISYAVFCLKKKKRVEFVRIGGGNNELRKLELIDRPLGY